MKVTGIIPARLASSRFHGKPLVDIGGKSMIQRVYEQAAKSTALDYLIVATDHSDIYRHVLSFGGNVVMTSENCLNGTERCAEAYANLNRKSDIIINIQGDEPFFEPESLDLLKKCFERNPNAGIATLIKKIEQTIDIENPTVVKVVTDKNKKALYFSRSAIPFNRDGNDAIYFKHIGIYAYRADILPSLVRLAPTQLENTEKLEQLRWLENGYSIYTAETSHESNSVDTPEDLENLKKQFGIS
jgi:3-deoxy-manno-octulosonate cytidylyltransferase (CMP-KDO synthetase)